MPKRSMSTFRRWVPQARVPQFGEAPASVELGSGHGTDRAAVDVVHICRQPVLCTK